jgi:hypothetical protein
MARSRPVKKSDPPAPAEHRVLPMELQVGDRLVDETGEIRPRPEGRPAGGHGDPELGHP